LAFIGPWAYETVNVPAQYACSGDYNIRVAGDFCAAPISGIAMLAWIMGGIIAGVVSLITVDSDSVMALRELALALLFLTLLLPVVSTLLLITRREWRFPKWFSLAAWGVALIPAILLASAGLADAPFGAWAWGVWLFIALDCGALLLEISLLRQVRHN
jgi:hypothetical protein